MEGKELRKLLLIIEMNKKVSSDIQPGQTSWLTSYNEQQKTWFQGKRCQFECKGRNFHLITQCVVLIHDKWNTGYY